ncbi:MAG: type VI secretion system tip protein TssI/VgrG [Sandaracinaceae bacterium]
MAGSDLIVRLEAEPLRGDELRVVGVQGVERISRLFDLTIEALVLTEAFDVESLLLAPTQLVYSLGDEEIHRLSGLVAEVNDAVDESSHEPRVSLRFVPRAYGAHMRETLDIFMDLTVPQTVEQCLQRSGLQPGEDFDVGGLEGSYAPREFIVQYRETDLAFISRLCEHLGIFYFIDCSSGTDVLVFGDRNATFTEIQRVPEVSVQVRAGSHHVDRVMRVDLRTRSLPQRYVVRDYNYRNPGVDLLAEATIDESGIGEVVEYGAHFKDPDEGGLIAQVRAEELRSQRRVYRGTSTVPNFFAGGTFMLAGHHRGDTELLLTEVEHDYRLQGDAAEVSSTPYRNRFVAIPKETAYRPPRETPKPRVHGVVTGIVEASQKNEYAEIDDEGRYRVTFLYDTAERQEGQASRPVRMAQPHSGAGYGMHFPLRPGTEVILTCVDGDPDRPIISGTVPNPQTASPVTGGNHMRNVIRTGGGNEINIDDEGGSERIKLSTPFASTRIQLGAPNDPNEGIYLSTAKDMVGAVKETYGVTTAYKSMISAYGAVFSENKETRFVGPAMPWDYAEKVAAAAAKTADFAKQGIAAAGAIAKGVQATHDLETKSHEERLKKKRRALLPTQYDESTASTVTVANKETGRLEERRETEDEWLERVGPERTAERERLASQMARAGQDEAARRQMLVVSEIRNDERAVKRAKEKSKDAEVAAKFAKKAGEVAEMVSQTASGAGVLWGALHKMDQKVKETEAEVIAQGCFAASMAVTGRRGLRPPAPASAPSILDVATHTSSFVGVKGAHLMSPSRAHVFGGQVIVHAAKNAHLGSKLRVAVTSRSIYQTAGRLFDVKSEGDAVVDVSRDSSWSSGRKMTLASRKDFTAGSLDARTDVVAGTELMISAGEGARAKAKDWKVEAKDGPIQMKASTRFELTTDDYYVLKGAKKSVVKGEKSKLTLRHGPTKAVLTSSSLTLERGQTTVEVASGGMTVDGPSVDISANGGVTINGSKVRIG